MIQDFIKAFILVFIAEFGDKSQILAMAFATRYKAKQVILGIFIGVFTNHCLAVLIGIYIATIFPVKYLQLISGALFLCFGFITLRKGKSVSGKKKIINIGVIFTISLAFFIGELGDKTQLTAMTLAIESEYPIIILTGTVSAMIFVACIGIFIVKKLKLNISNTFVKIISGFVFISFGLSKFYLYLRKFSVNSLIIASFLVVILFISMYFTSKLIEE
ncbi:TMEM165/GDT1 family protein [Sedimentibacter sp. zth1]|uniref:TMEM165/GDT1 family protein n=1 Tax=Sedimentibacter sp. zth1 TaxID=2816908 RepID=UPI001A912713|nr:TMEM165/GDT1 family protein [Sedimentibacter sp. zth1]QSX05331.1 TMEM165/GDT1 family protein [Sedimentibacter sp. zth1]